MSMMMIQAAALVLLLIVSGTSSIPSPLPPSYGDIKLDNNSVVWIYLGQDYKHNDPKMWGLINFYKSQNRDELTQTLCHQLGYDNGILSGKVLDAEYAK